MAGPNLDPFGFESNIFVWPQSLPIEKPINSTVPVPIAKRVQNLLNPKD
jgi:hypothetical protein